ncbi:RecBCD enzyme subunit RecD [Thalassotalea insulae]|uniref:RecBCD enzyme subunit RecD n=1 Tax=Thalassotalea insulae TaxID=2056778 RepID=A0ABQ6GWY7_9GAMM|nr:exodeoxyribonuclease V subunit alpha [Thalassotalea insulae]GLX80453.1 RecBCD enzyme subunit RecD [Thalassotalea insulae]
MNLLTEPHAIKMPYARYSEASRQIAGIEAIDYFFARQFSQLLFSERQESGVNSQVNNIFHCFLALHMSLRAGHSCLPLKEIAGQLLGFASDENGVVSHQGYALPDIKSLTALFNELAIAPDAQQAIIFDGQRLYLRRYYLFEQTLLSYLSAQQNSADHIVIQDEKALAQCINRLFPANNQINDEIDWQKVAVANALNKTFSVIAGGPGTGKTYTVTKLLAALVSLSQAKALKMALVAPTGKAAQRLSESIVQAVAGFSDLLPADILQAIPTNSQTIHRLLGVIPHSPNFIFNQDNKLDLDVLLVDEVSMVDLPLMARLLSALPSRCRVILLGDAQQLPSVAAGSVLADLTPIKQTQYSAENQGYLSRVTQIQHIGRASKNSVDYLTYLTKSRRFDGQGGIGLLANAVINGESEQSWQLLQQAKAHQVPQLAWYDNSRLWLTQLVKQYYLPLQQASSIEQAFDWLSQFRILAATRSGETGVENLNAQVETILQQLSPALQTNTHAAQTGLYHAKPIMILENDYALGLYNGDIGLIWRNNAGHLMAMFEQSADNIQAVLPSRLPQFETVYAMTIHKTQGSEFGHVAIVLPKDPDNQLLSRELLYTGITRAKQQLTIDSHKAVWYQGVERQVIRYSGFQE